MESKSAKSFIVVAGFFAVAAGLAWSQGHQLAGLFGVILAVWTLTLGSGQISRWLGLLVAGASALMVSLYLGVQHKGVAGKSICSVSETFDCDKVNSSVHAELFDIPIAFLGSSFYAGVIALAILSLRNPGGYKLAPNIVAAGAALSVLYSAFLAYASIEIGAWCLFCISLYGLNAITLYLSWGLAKQNDEGVFKGALAGGRSTNAFLGSAVVMLIGTMAWYSAGADEIPQGDSVEDLSSLFSAVEGDLMLDGTEPT